ncbi:SDR family oxidoreductase [Nocardioides marmorisolisilvae]|uniref:SDR family oxidoreductase n=1 Tax=Nocardioides marmorisolisilvae TaxID=1542737 RepID=A0A3N0DZU3_9ACTN|nr:SDR family oxidoreductase [Nocardioides marmorisolisilvae]
MGVSSLANQLSGKVAVVTGGARGIGRATAEALRAAGATVVVGDLPDLDVTDAGGYRNFLDKVEAEHGPLDILVNNAGIMPVGHLVEESEEVARRMFEINVFGVITGTKRALESMLPRRTGHIVNVASMAGVLYAPGAATYVGTKHAVLGFTETARLEYAKSGVELTAVLPAFVNTELTAGTKGVPGMKTVEPEDVAAGILEALVKPRPRVYVPKMAGRLAGVQKFAPRRVAEALSSRLGGDTVFLDDVDQAKRREYEERARHS